MREQINEQALEQVVGGTVVISKDKMKVGFTTTGEKFDLTNCTYRQARDFVEDLKEANPNMTNAEFDKYTKNQLKSKGWI